MIPVYQDKFGEEGNCLASCIASIFNLAPNAVPNFVTMGRDWFGNMWTFVRELGYEIVPYYVYGVDQDDKPTCEPLDFNDLPEHLEGMFPYYIVAGPAARGFSHATVGWKGKFLHDPHPSGAFLIQVDHYFFFKPVETKQ